MPRMLLDLTGAAALAGWVYLLAARGGFWREFLGSPAGAPPAPAGGRARPHIVAVIPARNEASVVAQAIGSLSQQQYSGRFHIVLVDDDSTDGTADAARCAAPPDLLTVLRAGPLPPGWTGKLWALSEGVRYAARYAPDRYLFTDADIVHPPGNLETLAARADCDLVSYMATLACRTPAERALIPAFVFFFLMLYPPVWTRSARHRSAGAAGGCMLIGRAMLEKLGGLDTIRGALIDDCTLASAVKRNGGRVWLELSAGTQSIRQYATFGEIGRMISRTAFTQLRHSALWLVGAVAGMFLTYLAPPLLTLFAPQPAAGFGALAWLLMSIAYRPALRFYRSPWFLAPLLPLVAAFYMGATVHSALAWWRGAGGEWKGRTQTA